MKFNDLYKSVFAILRIENGTLKVVGTGFVINTDPFYLLTCNHVVSEGTKLNDGNVKYSITKRSDPSNEFDLRVTSMSFLGVKKIYFKPEYDIAILEVDLKVKLI